MARTNRGLRLETWNDASDRNLLTAYGERRIFKGHCVTHWHDFYEWLWVEDGSGIVTVSGEDHPYSPGDIIFIHRNSGHGFTSPQGSILHCVQFKSEILIQNKSAPSGNQQTRKALPVVVHPSDSDHARNWPGLLEGICRECAEDSHGYLSQLSCISGILRIHVEATRSLGFIADNDHHGAADLSRVYGLQEFVAGRYAEALTLQDAARHLHISVSHLCRVSRDYLGCGFGQYLREYRMGIAQDLLESTELAITEVASLCGYEDPSSFARAFRRVTGSAPRNYRA